MLFEKIKKRTEILLLQFGDLLRTIITIPSTTLTLYREDNLFQFLNKITHEGLKNRKRLRWGCSIIMVSGMPIVVDEKYLQKMEDDYNVKKDKGGAGSIKTF